MAKELHGHILRDTQPPVLFLFRVQVALHLSSNSSPTAHQVVRGPESHVPPICFSFLSHIDIIKSVFICLFTAFQEIAVNQHPLYDALRFQQYSPHLWRASPRQMTNLWTCLLCKLNVMCWRRYREDTPMSVCLCRMDTILHKARVFVMLFNKTLVTTLLFFGSNWFKDMDRPSVKLKRLSSTVTVCVIGVRTT